MICIYAIAIESDSLLLPGVGSSYQVVRNSLPQFIFNPLTQLLRFNDSDTFPKPKYFALEFIVWDYIKCNFDSLPRFGYYFLRMMKRFRNHIRGSSYT